MSFAQFIFCLSRFANNNSLFYALRKSIQYIQNISMFGLYILNFIVTLFSTILDYFIDLYKDRNKISSFIFSYVAIILVKY